ncbi:trehalase family glycosidase [Chitinophaga horti]|uniref:Trehalase family glycosidase n=1 Tax=Chitinophaga horti TaxID=2920382 RepID=A0ABY6J423_9BACT|nr:trehalase family glycosidase [Chitinophaga horti]UYQ94416.1 trehalase family glycosidase [Chitinophaga horti]
MKLIARISYCLVLLLSTNVQAQRKHFDTTKLDGSHDLRLQAWGPYSKKYAGISHIADMQSGMRFDFSVLPGYYRNKLLVPNVRFESSYFPWKVTNDLRTITYRYELEWKDQVYTDVTYTVLDTASVLVKMHCVNNTTLPQNLSLNLIASIEYPEHYGEKQLRMDAGTTWRNAVDYEQLSYAVKRPDNDLVYDGWMRGEVRNASLVNGRGIGREFGRRAGDQLTYKLGPQRGTLRFLYMMKSGTPSAVQLSGMVNKKVIFHQADTLTVLEVPIENNSNTLTLTTLGGGDILLNGLTISPTTAAPLSVVNVPMQKTPATEENLAARTLLLKYPDVPLQYGITWDKEPFKIRSLKNDELDIFFRNETHNHVAKTINGNMRGDYANVFIRPLELAPNSSQTYTAVLSYGAREKVLAALKAAPTVHETQSQQDDILSGGQPYLFSQQLLKSTLLSNVVYPVYTQNQYIRHFTPGKWWNSLYTWDLGFIALGLTKVSPDLAADAINAYLTPAGSQSAFVHHGSPVPVQAYAFLELWNQTQSKALLAYFYPRLKQYYSFLVGRYGSSATNTLSSALLKTWDYFYNSGGWDDYPPQSGVHEQRLESTVTPVITTAHAIRFAKILRMAAQALSKSADIKTYDNDIKHFSVALQQHAWDAESGYFSYVVHDEAGQPKGHFKHSKSGANFNMGLDGAYPLVSGICTPAQQQILVNKIFSPEHMWSPSGIGVVDQSAPYYRTDGYWNGSVWMPHQWFVWKTMLDLDSTALAHQLASKALDVYKRETDASYYTFEHFLSASGRGAGWHQFSGLSTPVLAWFAAYYRVGTVTPGFETWINQQSFNADHSAYKASLSFDKATPAHQRAILLVMNPAFTYKATFKGKPIKVKQMEKGMLQVTLPATNDDGSLAIQTKQ